MSESILLLVEDNVDDVALALRALGKCGIRSQIVVARDGVEALDIIFGTASGRLPRLVLLDLKLPRIDGLEVLRRIRADERTRRIPVVVLTSSREERDVSMSYELGVNSYVQKPVDFDRFVEVVRQLGVYWLDLNIAHDQQSDNHL